MEVTKGRGERAERKIRGTPRKGQGEDDVAKRKMPRGGKKSEEEDTKGGWRCRSSVKRNCCCPSVSVPIDQPGVKEENQPGEKEESVSCLSARCEGGVSRGACGTGREGGFR